ncbi:hypothetical protein BSKO_00062 [Bryopsis sp. KO-2023]|nr:hypothetical protein BSKO_00062 [Bryopsis sp. KO-2023]
MPARRRHGKILGWPDQKPTACHRLWIVTNSSAAVFVHWIAFQPTALVSFRCHWECVCVMAGKEFMEWLCREGGVVHAGISLFHDFGGGRRGVVANQAISEGEELLLIPCKATLSWHTSEDPDGDPPQCRDDVTSALNQYGGDLSPFASAVLILLGEIRKKDSLYQHYIKTLPDDTCDCLMAWSCEEVGHLKGTSIESYSPSTMRNLYDDSLKPFFEANPALFGEGIPSYDEVLYAGCMVQSRAFHMQADNWVTRTAVEGTKLHMLPGIDMINHSCIKKERNSVLNRVNDSRTFRDDNAAERTIKGFFTMKAERDIKAGEEILHNYGDLSDSELLDIYGFVGSSDVVTNPHNGVTIPISCIMESCKKMSIGEILLLPASGLEELIAEKGGGTGSSSGAKTQDVSLGAMFLDASEWSELVCLSLLKAVGVCVQRYPEPLSQAVELLKKNSLPHREALAAQLRVAELRILEQTKVALVKSLLAIEQGYEEGSGGSDLDVEDDSSSGDELHGDKKRMKVK